MSSVLYFNSDTLFCAKYESILNFLLAVRTFCCPLRKHGAFVGSYSLSQISCFDSENCTNLMTIRPQHRKGTQFGKLIQKDL